MSKDGSITPRTVRGKPEDLPLASGEVASILKYDEQFEQKYEQRNKAKLEARKKHAFSMKTLDELSKYCGVGEFEGLKAKFSETGDAISKIRNLEQIKPCQITDSLRFVKTFQHRKDDAVADLEFSVLKPIVMHYGINSANCKIFIGHATKEGTLHPIELKVFEDAVKYLKDRSPAQDIDIRKKGALPPPLPGAPPTGAEDPLIPNNVVLVSFFPRKPKDKWDKLLEENTIVADEKYPKEAETHTTALWKTGSEEITIIDPTDRGFSQFLVSILNKTSTLKPYTFKMEDSKGVKVSFKGVNEKVVTEIYRPKHGPDKSLKFARDCTDIAVKIAFELNEQQMDSSVASVDLALAGTIEQISNLTLPKDVGLFKALQSSSVAVRHAARKLIDDAISVEKKLKKDPGVVLNALLKIQKLEQLPEPELLEHIQEVSGLIGDLNESLI